MHQRSVGPQGSPGVFTIVYVKHRRPTGRGQQRAIQSIPKGLYLVGHCLLPYRRAMTMRRFMEATVDMYPLVWQLDVDWSEIVGSHLAARDPS